MSQVIPSVVTKEENIALTIVPSPEEIWAAVKSIHLDSAPGPDGFNGHFFCFLLGNCQYRCHQCGAVFFRIW